MKQKNTILTIVQTLVCAWFAAGCGNDRMTDDARLRRDIAALHSLAIDNAVHDSETAFRTKTRAHDFCTNLFARLERMQDPALRTALAETCGTAVLGMKTDNRSYFAHFSSLLIFLDTAYEFAWTNYKISGNAKPLWDFKLAALRRIHSEAARLDCEPNTFPSDDTNPTFDRIRYKAALSATIADAVIFTFHARWAPLARAYLDSLAEPERTKWRAEITDIIGSRPDFDNLDLGLTKPADN